jgi:hypothetical protein
MSELPGGVMLKPEGGRLLLPDGTFWRPEHVPIERALPRIAMVPRTFAFSSGFEAIDLAESASLYLDDWEKLCLILGLGESAEGKWVAFLVALIVSRQNGKGSILEALELYWLFGTGEMLIGHSAHEYKTAMEAFRRVLALITNTDALRKKVKKVINANGEEGIELLTGQRLRFIARSKGAGRGFTFQKMVWDEAYALSREQQDAQLPTMSAVPNPQVWVTSSPPLTSETGEVMFQIRKAAMALGARLAFLDYGLAGSLDDIENIDLDDRDGWRMANPAEAIRTPMWPDGRISIETMERERVAMGDVGFARERLGIWPPDLTQGFTIISKEQWDAMCDPYSGKDRWEDVPSTMAYWPDPATPAADPVWHRPPTALTGRPVLALDVSPRNQGQVRTSISLASMRYDGKRHVELIKTASGTSWVVPDLIRLAKKINAIAIVIDPGSPAGSLLAELEVAVAEEVERERLPEDLIVTMAARDVAQAFGMIYDAANDGEQSVSHIGQSELTIAVGGGMKRPVGDGHAWDRRTAMVDITPIVSVTHGLWGLAKISQMDMEQILVAWG